MGFDGKKSPVGVMVFSSRRVPRQSLKRKNSVKRAKANIDEKTSLRVHSGRSDSLRFILFACGYGALDDCCALDMVGSVMRVNGRAFARYVTLAMWLITKPSGALLAGGVSGFGLVARFPLARRERMVFVALPLGIERWRLYELANS